MDLQTNKCWDVIVVGAGAAGLMAAIHAAREGASVLVLEHMERPGKKLLMTGNGKCNFTNEVLFHFANSQGETACEQYYHGACPAFVLPVIKKYDIISTLNFFAELGVMPVCRRGGYYPKSGQASGVLAAMLMECGRLGILIECEIGIRSIREAEIIYNKRRDSVAGKSHGFLIETKTGTYQSRSCILATGGKSYKKSGSDGSGFLYVERLGHHIQDLVPALVPMQSNLAFFKKVAGIRAEISADLYINGTKCASESGELQLTDYGVSGICMFQLSSLASRALRGGKRVTIAIDFLPEYFREQVLALIFERTNSIYAKNKTMEQSLIGLFADKLGAALLDEAAIPRDLAGGRLSDPQAKRLVDRIKHFEIPITATRSFEQAQVTAGGVDTSEVSPDTMGSRLIPGLYFAGEMLDVDGICGGFNLQWAWSSGALAGKSAAEYLNKHQNTNNTGQKNDRINREKNK